jgi:hypothetical protein
MSKRLHVHLHVDDLEQNIGFYIEDVRRRTRAPRDRLRQVMLDDPKLNFAISTHRAATGIDHLGRQTDDPAELAAMRAQAKAADLAMAVEVTFGAPAVKTTAACCPARAADPQAACC